MAKGNFIDELRGAIHHVSLLIVQGGIGLLLCLVSLIFILARNTLLNLIGAVLFLIGFFILVHLYYKVTKRTFETPEEADEYRRERARIHARKDYESPKHDRVIIVREREEQKGYNFGGTPFIDAHFGKKRKR